MLAVYVSGHGFGHSTRTAEVLRKVRERAPGHERHVLDAGKGPQVAGEREPEEKRGPPVGLPGQRGRLPERRLPRRQVAVDPVPGEVPQSHRGHARAVRRGEGQRRNVSEDETRPRALQPACLGGHEVVPSRRELAAASGGRRLVDHERVLLDEAHVALEPPRRQGRDHHPLEQKGWGRGGDGDR